MLPVLGTRAAGFDFEAGAKLVCAAVRAYEPATLIDVRVIAYGDAEYETLRRVAEAERSGCTDVSRVGNYHNRYDSLSVSIHR